MRGGVFFGRISVYTLLAAILLLLLGCGADVASAPPPVPTPTATVTAVPPSPTPSPIPTPSPTATPTVTPLPPTPTPEPLLATVIDYTVQPGDTLTWILETLGEYEKTRQDTQFAYIAALNGMEDIDLLRLGQTIRIPVNMHIVAPGDTLPSIAALRNTTVEALVDLNPRLSAASDVISAGSALLVRPNSVQRSLECAAYTVDLPEASAEAPVVFETVITSREQFLCTLDTYGISAATVLKQHPEYRAALASADFGANGLQFNLPTTSGGTFEVTEAEMTADYIAGYYGLPLEELFYWNGDPLSSRDVVVGNTVFARGADLNGKAVFGSAPGPTQQIALAQAGQGTDVVIAADPSTGLDPFFTRIPSSDPPPGALRPEAQPPWRNGAGSPGWCDPQYGFGWTGSPVWPTDQTTLDPNRGFGGLHTAIDIVGTVGDPVYAAESGVVIWAGPHPNISGSVVVLAHGNTWQTVYWHLRSVSVGCGQVVNRGQQIGTMGQAGLSHVHFAVLWQGFAFNPLNYLP